MAGPRAIAEAAPLVRYAAEWCAATGGRSADALAPPYGCEAYRVAVGLCGEASSWQAIRHSPVALAIYAARVVI